jgi:uncharacterized protein (DUF169 family)
MQYEKLAAVLHSRLELDFPPIALAFAGEPPRDVPRTDAVVPSTCAFWRRAEREVFFAPAEAHFNCALGAMVMGFPLPSAHQAALERDVQMMCELAYVAEAEVPRVPAMPRASAGIVYGPLARFPLRADAVVLWLTPEQGMVLAESRGQINWTAEPMRMLGRPGCAAIPAALAAGQGASSFGCTGMRINTGIPRELYLTVLPGAGLDTLAHDLERTCGLHAKLSQHYLAKQAALAPAT